MLNPYSTLKIFHHANLLDRMADGEAVAPLYIRLKPTNICNHHCAYCTYGSGNTVKKTTNRNAINHKDMIPWDKLQEIVTDMSDIGVRAVTLSGGGEPLTYPNISELLELLKKGGIEISLISNGSLLEDDVAEKLYDAKWVRISFDSPIEEEYCRLRGLDSSDYKRVVRNIKNFAEHKENDCVFGINFVISKDNYLHVYEGARFLKELGVNNVKFAAVIENEKGYHGSIKDNVIEQIHKAKEELEDDRFLIINNYEGDWMDKQYESKTFEVCYTCRLVTVIAADCKVYFCHTRAYESSAVIGNLSNRSFKEMWYASDTEETIKALNPRVDCNNFCVYEERNRLIQAYYDVDNAHVNFI